MLEYIVRGAASAVLPMNLLVMFIGLVVGIVGGMLPGITTVTAVALFVPFTFSMPPDMALIGLGGVFRASTAGPTPILINAGNAGVHRHLAGRLSAGHAGQGRGSLLHRPDRFGPRRHFRDRRTHAVL
ncbi:MAG: tripartite tricarboxylate transporter permease [Bilophila wadsworthia]